MDAHNNNIRFPSKNSASDGDSPGEEAVERDELLLPDGPDVVLEGLLQLVQLIPQLVRRRRVVPAHAQMFLLSNSNLPSGDFVSTAIHLEFGILLVICISKEDKLENPMQCYFHAMYLRLPFSIAPEFVKANSEKAQGLSRRTSGRSLARPLGPPKVGKPRGGRDDHVHRANFSPTQIPSLS